MARNYNRNPALMQAYGEWLATGFGPTLPPTIWQSLTEWASNEINTQYLMMMHPLATAQGTLNGLADGGAMVLNAGTFGAITPLNNHVNNLVATNGGVYGVANFSANIGVGALYALPPCGAVRAIGSGLSAYNGVNNVYQGWVQQNPGMMAQGVGSLAIGLMNPNCFVAGTRVLVPDDGQAPVAALMRDASLPSAEDGEQGLPFWPLVVLTAGIGGYAAAKVKSADDEKRRKAALRSLFGEDDGKLNDENEGACPMNCDADQPDYERRIDALCEALFHGDELLGATAAAREDSALSCQAAAAPPRRQQSQRVSMCVERRAPRSPKRPRRRLPGRPIRGAAATLWLLACLVLAGWLGLRSPTVGVPSTGATTGRIAAKADNHATVAIENIRVGQRVLGENPDLAGSPHNTRTAVDPATWRLLKLHADWRWEDGTLDTIEVETLQPPSWI
ncbi:MAG: hypothetical protein ACREHD_17680, partial [Pirellulales bacterium]